MRIELWKRENKRLTPWLTSKPGKFMAAPQVSATAPSFACECHATDTCPQIDPAAKLWRGNGLGHYMKYYMRYILSKFAFIIVMTE